MSDEPSKTKKETEILDDLRRRAREDIRNGKIMVEFKIQDGTIMTGTLKGQEIWLGVLG